MMVAGLPSASDKPRVISEVKKTNLPKRRLTATSSLDDTGRPKISGELLWSATPTQWHVKFAEVRHGSLFVYCSDTGVAEFRLPLHHLNLQQSRTPRTFTLAAGHGIPLATFQTLTEEEYDRWVRILAVEVLRQTPLQDVRYLDIIGITRNDRGMRRGRSEECLTSTNQFWETPERKLKRNKYNFKDECKKKKERTEFSQWLHCVKREKNDENVLRNTDFDMKNMKIRRAQRVRPKLPFAETWKQVRGEICEPVKVPCIRSLSMENLKVVHEEPIKETSLKFASIEEKKEIVSDESGISSGDENNNVVIETATKAQPPLVENCSFVSVREKKKFFESLSGEKEKVRSEVNLNRSNSIGYIDMTPPLASTLRRSQRASSMQNLSGNSLPVREMRRFFETQRNMEETTKSCENLSYREMPGSCIMEEDETSKNSPKMEIEQVEDSQKSKDGEIYQHPSPFLLKPIERKPKETVNYANIQFGLQLKKSFHCIDEESDSSSRTQSRSESSQMEVSEPDSSVSGKDTPENGNNGSSLLIQRKLQRGERKLGKLRIQIAEVEDTIKIIAEDLHSIGPDTLKRRKGLEVFAALRRRLEEETSRLERLQEETAKVIADNQRTIQKITTVRCSK